ncbi:MAG TPA: isoprenylcysteine carboxylmethyltransferase family protein [Candidatus Saccharimonadales bacterium]|nr:isoprenylcysteine carboxylmethyltransferase family protein [Candidatus Saccharimonadales bacterium]
MSSVQRTSRIPSLGPRGEGWVIGQVVLLGACVVLGVRNIGRFDVASPVAWLLLLVGPPTMLLGAVLLAAGVRDLGLSMTPWPRPHEGASLVETGIYDRMRNPIYAGMIVLAIGWAAFTSSPTALLAGLLLASWLDLKARREEAWLSARYPGYDAYRSRTSRFVPGIY